MDGSMTTHHTLGDLIVALYDQFLEIYEDIDLASVATAALVNEHILHAEQGLDEEDTQAA